MDEYFVFTGRIFNYKGGLNLAKLITPRRLSTDWYYGTPPNEVKLKDAAQVEPYPANLSLAFQVPGAKTYPDNYATSGSFKLYSQRLVDLFKQFHVNGEAIPATLVDQNHRPLTHTTYFVYHYLGMPQDVMDEVASTWTGDYDTGVPSLVIDTVKAAHQPVITVNKVFCQIMHRDLKSAIEQAGITGFTFYPPSHFRSGKYGFPSQQTAGALPPNSPTHKSYLKK